MAKRLKDGFMPPASVSWTAKDTRELMRKCFGAYISWNKIYKQGWRIVKVEVRETKKEK